MLPVPIRDNKDMTMIPSDIISFIVENGYDNDLLYNIVYNKYYIGYNFAEIYKTVLKVGKHFKTKATAIGNDTNALLYVSDKINNKSGILILHEFDEKFSLKDAVLLAKYSNIHDVTMLYRVLYNDMTMDEAVKAGILDRDKYDINYNTYRGKNKADLIEIFTLIAREYIEETA